MHLPSVGWGQARWGEGKWGGVEQVIITTKDAGKRALSSVLQNVFDAQPLPPISEYWWLTPGGLPLLAALRYLLLDMLSRRVPYHRPGSSRRAY